MLTRRLRYDAGLSRIEINRSACDNEGFNKGVRGSSEVKGRTLEGVAGVLKNTESMADIVHEMLVPANGIEYQNTQYDIQYLETN